MYQTIDVYELRTRKFVFLCRGTAINKATYSDETAANLITSRLLCTKRQRAELMDKNGDIEIYRYTAMINGQRRVSDWYLHDWDARNCPLAHSNSTAVANGWIESWWLDTTQVQPIQFPFVGNLQRSKDGRFCIWINLHPEIDGVMANRVVCFPDRNMGDVCKGRVLITGITEKGNYAFLQGHMFQYGMPDMEKFLDYAWKNLHADMQTPLCVVDHPILGKLLCTDEYIWVETASSPDYKAIENDERRPYVKVPWTRPDDLHKHVKKRTSLEKLILEDAFGDEQDIEQRLLERFETCSGAKRVYNEPWSEGDTFVSRLVSQAVTEGIMDIVSLPAFNIHALEVHPEMLYRLAGFSNEEIIKIATDFSRVNKKADEMILAELKKGNLGYQT